MQGPWSPAKIANPAYFLDEAPLKNIGKIGGVAIEIWTMDNDYYFSNILIDNDPAAAEKARKDYWEPKLALEVLGLPQNDMAVPDQQLYALFPQPSRKNRKIQRGEKEITSKVLVKVSYKHGYLCQDHVRHRITFDYSTMPCIGLTKQSPSVCYPVCPCKAS